MTSDALLDNLGLLPYRRRITAVGESLDLHVACFITDFLTSFSSVGRPIPVKRVNQPDIEEVRRVQTLYIAELQRYALFIFP